LKNITIGRCFLKICLQVIIIMSLLYGGGKVFSDIRHKYRVMAEKVGSGVKTVFLVYSDTEENAKEEVALNGWKILEIRNVEDTAAFTIEKKYQVLVELSNLLRTTILLKNI